MCFFHLEQPAPPTVQITMPRKRPRVALLIETSNAYARGILQGVRAYMRTHGPWSIYLGEHRRGELPPDWLRHWDGDGMIARIETAETAEVVRQTGLPVVDVSAARHLPNLPYVETDDPQIARLAATHLIERGFTNLAFCGDARFSWSNNRCRAFAEQVAAAGHTCSIYSRTGERGGSALTAEDDAALEQWLRSLSKPAGVMATYDAMGRHILEACRRIGIAVPDDLAVIGADNDELICDFSDPPLSSVIPDSYRTGYEAAAILDRMMQGEEVGGVATFIQPLGVVTRQSTDVLAIDDAQISTAVRFIRENACDGINVADILKAVPLSRRVLESRFKRLIGRTPHEEILRIQVDRIQQLLSETDLPLSDIAEMTGFKHVEYMSVVFKKKTAQPPSVYRSKSRRAVS
jgi:LacI family transcriptional regulator